MINISLLQENQLEFSIFTMEESKKYLLFVTNKKKFHQLLVSVLALSLVHPKDL